MKEVVLEEISLQEAGGVDGGWSLLGYIVSQGVTMALSYSYKAAASGQLDYAGVAESSGSYYNMMGA